MVIYDSEVDKDITTDLADKAGLVHGDIFMKFEFCEFDLSGLLRSPKAVIINYTCVYLCTYYIHTYIHVLMKC
jgi:hypothetical protein